MDLTLETIPVPLRDDGHGGLRVGRTRVSLESVWHMHQQGASPADIVRAFDTLQLANVHAVLAWALLHADDLGAYLKRRDEEAVQIRRRLEEAGLTPTRAARRAKGEVDGTAERLAAARDRRCCAF